VNTDIVGFLAPLEAATAGEGFPARAVVVGAGGVARAAVYALVERGLSVLLLNRTLARAQELADTINRAFGPASGSDAPTGSRTGSESTPQEGSSPEPAEGPVIAAALGPDSAELMQAYAGLIVQTTRVGMTPDEDADPVSFYEFTGTETVYDLVYTPERTRLLGRAAAAGCRTVSGKDMFIRQAEEQARLFAELLAPP
jgi:shikimate 5-dehydrogenase